MKSFIYKIFLYYIFEVLELLVTLILCIELSLPNIDTSPTQLAKTQYIEFYDNENKLIDCIGDQLNIIDIELLPNDIIKALISIEDKNFFDHNGLDYKSIVKNMYINLSTQEIIAGGSTISQQLAKNILQNQNCFDIYDRSILRKIKEMLLTYQLERKYNKTQILYFYLNRIFFGKNCYGVESAAQFYFEKSASALNLYESVLLVSLIQSPSRYSQNITAWKIRAKRILAKMKELKFISEKEENDFDNFEIPYKPSNESNIKFFTNFIAQNLPFEYLNRDIKIKTTFDSHLYEKANKSLQEAQNELGEQWNSDEGAFVLISKNGAIKVLIGGLNYAISNFNIAINAKRPTGSTAKYFTYLTAIEMGLNPKSLINDAPFSFGEWKPSNYLHRTTGEVQVDVAFAQSINSISAKIIQAVTPKKVVKMIKRLNINDPVSPTLALSLGGLNTSLTSLTQAFLPIINKGYLPEIYCIEEIIDIETGKSLYKHEEKYKEVIDQRTAYYMWNMMKRTVSPYGTGKQLKLNNKPFGGKSGTSNENKDLYFILANADYCIGCWFGRKDFKPMNNTFQTNLTILCLNKFFENLEITSEDLNFDLNLDDINNKTLIDLMII